MIPFLENNKGLIYFDNSATTQKPKEVINAITKYYSNINSNPFRGMYHTSELTTQEYESARHAVARFIGGIEENVIFTKSATESLNLVAYSYGMDKLKEGDEILIYIGEHHSNMLPWFNVAGIKKCKVSYFYDMEDAIDKINDNTKIVAVTMQSNVLGEINDITEIVRTAHKYNAIVVADATQFIAHDVLDVIRQHLDFVAFSGHKMYAPMGIGVLYGKTSLLQDMKPFLYGGEMVNSVLFGDSVVYKDPPYRFEAGTPNVEGAIGLKTAIELIGYNHVREELLTHELLKGFNDIPYIHTVGKNQKGIVSFYVDGVHPHDVAEYLSYNNICIRAGKMCAEPLLSYLGHNALCRVSFGYYNNLEEVHRFLDVISNVRGFYHVQ